MVNVYVCNSWYLPKRWAVFRAHIPLAAIKRIRRSKIKQEYITSSWLGFVVFTTRDNFAGYKTPFYYKLYIKIWCMKLLFANRKDTNIKYWMRHKNKTDFFFFTCQFQTRQQNGFSLQLSLHIYVYINTYISKSFLLCWCELYLQRIRMKDVLCLWINILDVFSNTPFIWMSSLFFFLSVSFYIEWA